MSTPELTTPREHSVPPSSTSIPTNPVNEATDLSLPSWTLADSPATFHTARASPQSVKRCRNESTGTKSQLTHRHFNQLINAFITAPLLKSKPRATSWTTADHTPQRSKGSATPTDHFKLRNIVLTDANQPGFPISWTSDGYTDPQHTNVLTVGRERFLNTPYGEDWALEHCFRIETTPDRNYRVLMSTIHEVLTRSDSSLSQYLVAEVDTSSAVADCVRAELAGEDKEVEIVDILSTTSPIHPDDGSTGELVDWCHLASTQQAEEEVDNLVAAACELFTHLDVDTCSTTTHTLLAYLSHQRSKYENFALVLSTPLADGGRISVPSLSRHLEWEMHARLGLMEGERRVFREELVGAVAGPKSAAFGVEVVVGGAEVRALCAPLEGWGREGRVWACFVEGLE